MRFFCFFRYSDGALKTAASEMLKKMGKNNNKWLTDSSDTDGSQANSATQMKPTHEDSRAASSSLASHNVSSPSFPRPLTRDLAETEPGTRGAKGSDSDSEAESGFAESASKTVRVKAPLESLAVCVRSSDSSETSVVTVHSDRGRRKRRRSKKRRRSRTRNNFKKKVRWKDEFYPWDTFDPVSSVLCDEDVCTRLCQTAFGRDDCLLRQNSACLSHSSFCLPRSTSVCLSHSSCCILPCSQSLACRDPVIRQNSSCISLGTGRNRLEMAFFKAEAGLTVSSSSASSDCDSCPFASLPEVFSSSSGESCSSYQFSNFHVSSHNVSRCSSSSCHGSSASVVRTRHFQHDLHASHSTILPLPTASFIQSQHSQYDVNPTRSVLHSGSLASVVRRQRFVYDVNSSHVATPDKSTVCSKTSRFGKFDCKRCSSPDCSSHCSASFPSQKSSSKVELSRILPDSKPLCLSLQPCEPSPLQESCYTKYAGPEDSDAACQKKIERSSPLLDSDTNSVQAKCVDSTSALGKVLPRTSRRLNNSNDTKDSPDTHEKHSDNLSSNSSQFKVFGVFEIADEGETSQSSAAQVGDEHVLWTKTEGNQKKTFTASSRDGSNPRLLGHAKWIENLDQQLIPRSVNLEIEKSHNHESRQKLDCMNLNRDCPPFPPFCVNSFDVSGMGCLPSVMSDELLGLYGTGSLFFDDDFRLSLKTFSNTSGDVGVVSDDPEKERARPTKHLKRKVSYDSLDVANSSNNFSKSARTSCSLPKYAFTFNRSVSVHEYSQNGWAESDFEDNWTNSQPFKHSKMLMHIPIDLELEFCKRKGWIH